MKFLSIAALVILVGCQPKDQYETYELFYAPTDSPQLRMKVATFEMEGDRSQKLNGTNCWKIAKFFEGEINEVSPGSYRYWCEATPKH